MKRTLAIILILVMIVTLTSCGSKNDGQFTMSSDDTVGAVRHTLVGTDNCEPGGNYTVVCTGGHGALIVNEKELFVLAADSYLGEEYSGLNYEQSITIWLKQNDELKARNFNSSKFKLEFTYVDPTVTAETTSSESTTNFDIDAYKQSISTCMELINESAILLHNAVSMECKYLDLLGREDAEGAFDTAMKFLEEKSGCNEESLRTQYEDISGMYKEIITETIDGAEAQEIKESYENLFDAYVGLYDLAMSPTGTPSTISNSHDEYISVIQTESSKLGILLQ